MITEHLNHKRFFFSTVIVFMTFLAYINALENPFVWDDYDQVVLNQDIRSLSSAQEVFLKDLGRGNSAFFRPIQTLSYILDYHYWGLDPAGYHISNMAYHIGVSVCLYWFFLLISQRGHFVPFFAALIYAVHPVHTEAVTYIAGRADSLAGVFMLASMIAYLYFRKHQKSVYLALSLVFFAIALNCREIAMLLPLWILLYNRVLGNADKKTGKSVGITIYIGYILVLLIYLLYRFNVVTFGKVEVMPYPLSVRLLTTIKAFPEYIRILIIPNDLHMSRWMPISRSLLEGQVIFSIASFLFSLYLAHYYFTRQRVVTFFILWFMICLIPASNIIPLNAAIAEHWIYLASAGWFYVLTLTIYQVTKRYCKKYAQITAACLCLGLVISYLMVTIYQNLIWKDPVKLYSSILKLEKEHAPFGIYNNLGLEYKKNKNYPKAIETFRQGLKRQPESAVLYFNLGHVYLESGAYAMAIEAFSTAHRLSPEDNGIMTSLANSYYLSGNYSKAAAAHSEIISKSKNKDMLSIAHYNLGRTYMKMNDKNRALAHFRETLAINPGHPKAKKYADMLKGEL